ncbi:MAG: hypothetical protein AAF824_18875 [Bacteroidota bacterium]
MKTLFPSLLLIFFIGPLFAQPETHMAYPQVKANQSSYAATHVPIILKEANTFEFYKEQSENWWKVLEKDMTDEYAWYNYHKANRYAKLTYSQIHSPTENWQENTDWIKESTYFMDRKPMENLIAEHLPESFIYYYITASNNEVKISREAYLDLISKAHKINPGFAELYDGFITHYYLTGNTEKRQYYNKQWFASNDFSPTLLNHYYNVLQSTADQAILLTYGDNSTFGLLMVQDALGIRPDVQIINGPLLSMDKAYRERIYQELAIPLPEMEEDLSFQEGVSRAIMHLMDHKPANIPLHLNMDLGEAIRAPFQEALQQRGLVYTVEKEDDFHPSEMVKLYEESFQLDYTHTQFTYDPYANSSLSFLNYLPMIMELYPYYLSAGKREEATQLKEWGLQLIERSGRAEVKDWYLGELAG